MDNFQIESAQNVSIQQNVAGVGDRILAFFVDGLIILAFIIIMNIGINSLDLGRENLWVYSLVLGLPVFLYHLLFETFWNGRSLGKAAMNIRVVKLDGSKPAFSNFVIRWLLRIVDISLTSGSVAVVAILWNGKGQRLGDIAAATTVISEKKRVSLRDTLMVELPENYEPKYPQVSIFSDQEIQTIKTLFMDAKRKANHKIILSLSEKVARLMEVKPAETPMVFIDRVISDYNYYTQL